MLNTTSKTQPSFQGFLNLDYTESAISKDKIAKECVKWLKEDMSLQFAIKAPEEDELVITCKNTNPTGAKQCKFDLKYFPGDDRIKNEHAKIDEIKLHTKSFKTARDLKAVCVEFIKDNLPTK